MTTGRQLKRHRKGSPGGQACHAPSALSFGQIPLSSVPLHPTRGVAPAHNGSDEA
jgi:hypothetical protein